jgi:hypothetical protein
MQDSSGVRRWWNWKSAVISAAMRGPIFFFATLSLGLRAAAIALLLDASFRTVLAGFMGALTQAVRYIQPTWIPALIVVVGMPVVNHTIEYFVHRHNMKLGLAMGISIGFSMISGAFELFAMRRGTLVVTEHSQSLGHDILRFPKLVADFVMTAVRALLRIEHTLVTPESRDRVDTSRPPGGNVGRDTGGES